MNGEREPHRRRAGGALGPRCGLCTMSPAAPARTRAATALLEKEAFTPRWTVAAAGALGTSEDPGPDLSPTASACSPQDQPL